MNAQTVKNFWNNTFADESNPERVVRLHLFDYVTGREITIDGALVKAEDTLYTVFKDIVTHLEANPPVEETPVVQARETHIAHFAEINHNKKVYYVEEHKDGTFVIQTPEKDLIGTDTKTGQAILKKYQESKQSPPPEE